MGKYRIYEDTDSENDEPVFNIYELGVLQSTGAACWSCIASCASMETANRIIAALARVDEDGELIAKRLDSWSGLYEACRKALTCACIDSAVRAQIVNALAKADGEGE